MRKSGILLPVFSLHGNYGIGTLGSAAYEFIDFLSQSGQYYWQILPLNPTSYGNSPYQSPSVFAFNPYFIDPDFLVRDGFLNKSDIGCLKEENSGRIDYARLYKTRMSLLRKAAEKVSSRDSDYLSFIEENKFWLSDYGAFMALKEENNMLPHYKWTKKITDTARAGNIGITHCKIQFLFSRQWLALKKYANDKGVHIIGDLPIYPSLDSSDFYFGKENFLEGEVAACPPDSFSPNGQLWGNPIYNWQKMEQEGFIWWKERLRQAKRLFDTVRIDHFRGIYEYYSVKENASTAINGKWHKGPGMSFVAMIKESFPDLEIIAEDLGFLTDDVRAFFKESGFDGMKILQFAFGDENSEYLPHNYTKNSVAYTGTHDNPTVKGWLCTCNTKELLHAMDYLGVSSVSRLCDSFIRAVLSSVCRVAIIPLQDWLSLGCSGRINTPGTVGKNWEFRINESCLTHNLSEKILYYTKLYNRAKE
ncbi:MAG: 4-alpha-glucanotransferase [Clostridia bacterium]|nr:4-alpha-glucanotransferase [Clostridia bacterium]